MTNKELLDSLQNGDIVLVQNRNPLSYIIRLFTRSKFSHAEILCNSYGELESVGATGLGVRGTNFRRYTNGKYIKIMRHKSLVDMDKTLNNYIGGKIQRCKGIDYDYKATFHDQSLYAITDEWIGDTDIEAIKKFNCFEFAPWIVGIKDYYLQTGRSLSEHKDLITIYEGKVRWN